MKREHSRKRSEGIYRKTCAVAATATISVICLAYLLLGRMSAADVAGVPAAGLGNTICDPGKGGPCGTAPVNVDCHLVDGPPPYKVCAGNPIKDLNGPCTNDALTNGVGNVTLCPIEPCLTYTEGECVTLYYICCGFQCYTQWAKDPTKSGHGMVCASPECPTP
jgi:hypothetical protein